MSPVVMIVEDEIFVALDLAETLQEQSMIVEGPFATVSAAIAHASVKLPDCAILDVRLADGEVFPLADYLAARQVPIVFHSGHAHQSDIGVRYPGSALCEKPCRPETMLRAVRRAVAAVAG